MDKNLPPYGCIHLTVTEHDGGYTITEHKIKDVSTYLKLKVIYFLYLLGYRGMK